MSWRIAVAAGDLPLCDALLGLILACLLLTRLFGFSSSGIAVFPVHLIPKFTVGIFQAVAFFLAFSSALGHLVLYHFYRHAVTTVFNAEVPPPWTSARSQSRWEIYKLARPLEACWRLATAPWRALPDVVVMGEVRCGTTTLCAHLAGLGESSQSFAPPFCPWKHPELDAKETFYFAGHYLGLVEPRLYPMCFPPTQGTFLAKLVATRARLGAAAAGLCALLTGQSSSQDKVQSAKRDQQWTFDGCAQYLSSPAAAHLLAAAYKHRQEPPPMLIACVRKPADQAVSWWRYEWAAIAWGRSFGLSKPNNALRGPSYPPTTITRALELSHSRPTRLANAAAERLAQRIAMTPQSSTATAAHAPRSTSATSNAKTTEIAPTAASEPALSADDELWVSALMDPPRSAFEQKSWQEKLARALAGYVAGMNNSPHEHATTASSSAGGNDNGSSNVKSSPIKLEVGVLPSWALTWPGGQLACIGRSGDFAANIMRVEAAFAASNTAAVASANDDKKTTGQFVTVVDLSELASSEQLSTLLLKVASSIRARRRIIDGAQLKPLCHGRSNEEKVREDGDSSGDGDATSASFLSRVEVEAYLKTHLPNDRGSSTSSNGDRTKASNSQPLKRNAGPTTLRGLGNGPNGATTSGMGEEPSNTERNLLERHFAGQGKALESLRGHPLLWK